MYGWSWGPLFAQCCQDVQFGAVIIVIWSLKTTDRRIWECRKHTSRANLKACQPTVCSVKTGSSQKSTACCVKHRRMNIIGVQFFLFSDQSRSCVDFHDTEDLYEEQKENFKDNTDLVIIHNTDNHCNGIKWFLSKFRSFRNTPKKTNAN